MRGCTVEDVSALFPKSRFTKRSAARRCGRELSWSQSFFFAGHRGSALDVSVSFVSPQPLAKAPVSYATMNGFKTFVRPGQPTSFTDAISLLSCPSTPSRRGLSHTQKTATSQPDPLLGQTPQHSGARLVQYRSFCARPGRNER
jgi:hypothetical protein